MAPKDEAELEEKDPVLFPTKKESAPEEAVAAKRHAVPLWGSYLKCLEKAPIRTKCITSVIILGFSQYMSQRLTKGFLHDRRGLKLWAFWGLILGFLNHHWQAAIAKYGPKQFIFKVGLDHLLWKVPALYVFVTYERMMRGAGFSEAVKASLTVNPPLQRTSVKVFPLVQILNFTVVPLPLRVLYMNSTLLFWSLYLSLKMR